MTDERDTVATNGDAAATHNVIAVTVDDYAESLALQRQMVELNQRSVAAYEDRAERAAASNERIAAALEAFVDLVRQALEAGDAQ